MVDNIRLEVIRISSSCQSLISKKFKWCMFQIWFYLNSDKKTEKNKKKRKIL